MSLSRAARIVGRSTPQFDNRSSLMTFKAVVVATGFVFTLIGGAAFAGDDHTDDEPERADEYRHEKEHHHERGHERERHRRPFTVKVIGFNDYHGNLQSPGTFGVNTLVPSAQRPAVGGAEYLAAYVARMKAANPLNVVVGAGDFIGASPLISALFFDEPAVETLNKIGIEFNAVGNHEFDKGSAELNLLQGGGCKITNGLPDPNSCKGLGSGAPGTFDGAKFKWLSANVFETATGRPLLPPYGVKTFNGVKVAFIGMTLKGTPGIVTPTGVAGLEFRDEADTVNALVPRLRARGIEAIVVLVHQGGFQTSPNVGDINGCDGNLKNADGSDTDIAAIVKRLDSAVDLVISGHTHAAYNCSANTVDVKSVGGATLSTPRATGLPNRIGRLVPVTSASAFGRVLTDIDLTIDPRTRDVIAVAPTNRLVDRTDPEINQAIATDPTVKNVVAGYNSLVSPLANQVIGTITAPLSNAANAAGEMPAGSLIADAQLLATQPSSLGGAVIAFMNAGGVRSPGFAVAGATYPYNVTYGDAFTVQPFGNSLVTLTLTGQQLKNLLEQQFVGCLGQTAQRIMQVSNGLKYSWSAAAAPCSKIVDLTLTRTDLTATPPVVTAAPETIVASGVVQNPARTYRVTVNNFIANGADGFSVLPAGTDALGGAQDIDALTAYLAGNYRAPKPPYDPALPAQGLPRITRLP
jgi:5'-nucleotidase